MPAIVPPFGQAVIPYGVFSGRTIRSDHWAPLTSLVNYLNGVNGPLVAAHNPLIAITPGNIAEFRYYVAPRDHARWRLWVIGIAGAGYGTVQALLSGSAQPFVTLPIAFAPQIPGFDWRLFHLEEIGAGPATDDGEIMLTVGSNAGSAGNIQVHSVACYELPRLQLDVASDSVEALSLLPDALIQADATRALSIPAIIDGIFAARSRARRASLWAHSGGSDGVISSTSFADLFAYPVPVLTRKLDSGQSTGTVACAVRSPITGTGGEVRFTAASGDTLTLTIDGSGAGPGNDWYAGELDVDCDDLGNYEGGQTGREFGDEITVEGRAVLLGTIDPRDFHIFEFGD